MKNLYNVVEGILDDQDVIMQQAEDDAIGQIVYDAFGLSDSRLVKNVKWDKKKKVVKIAVPLHLTEYEEKVCIFSPISNGKYTPIEQLTNLGISFDGSLLITSDAISTGFKLSQAHIVGKKHSLILYQSPTQNLTEGSLKTFLDCPTTAFELIDIGKCQSIINSSSVSQFPAVKVDPPYRFSHVVSCEIENCSAPILYATNCSRYIDPNTKYKSFADAFKRESDYSYTRGYSFGYGEYGSQTKITHKQFCVDLIKKNPGCKIIVELGFSKPTLIWMEGSELKYKEIVGNKPWQKV